MAAAAGRLYAVHCLWWVRRTGRERCKGKGRERGRIICASISRIAAEGVRRRERCRLLQQIGEEGGEAESSLALYANQQDPRAQMSHDREEPAPCSHSRARGAVSAQRWCHDLFWGSDVRPLQWGWPCSTVVLLNLTVTADVKWQPAAALAQKKYIKIHEKDNLMMKTDTYMAYFPSEEEHCSLLPNIV